MGRRMYDTLSRVAKNKIDDLAYLSYLELYRSLYFWARSDIATMRRETITMAFLIKEEILSRLNNHDEFLNEGIINEKNKEDEPFHK
jgi:hypothetical protein